MKKTLVHLFVFLATIIFTVNAYATNGDILIGVGTERGMGGAGMAMIPQDAVGGMLLNPAGIAAIDKTMIDIGTTLFLPNTSARANLGVGSTDDNSEANYFIVPAVGFAVPITKKLSAGIASYGISGMGVDYVNKNVGNTSAFAAQPAPYNSFVGALDFKTTKQLFQIIPTIAYEFIENRLYIGASPMINYGMLDLGQGNQQTLGIGGKFGVMVKATNWFSIAAAYKTSSKMKYSRVYDFNGDGQLDSLRLDQPQQVSFGIAIEPIEKLFFALDGKWINWENATGYNDFGWQDQWVAALGAQYQINKVVTLRAGYNYARNPIKNDSGFVSGTSIGTGPDTLTLQGNLMNGGEAGVFAYEAFRVLGFPAIVEHHITFGASFNFAKHYGISVSYMHAFENSLNETGTLDGNPVSFGSSLAEDTVTLMFHFTL